MSAATTSASPCPNPASNTNQQTPAESAPVKPASRPANADPEEKPELGTNVPTSALAPSDPVVRRFNELSATISHELPAMARAYDTLHQHLPMLREMQALLSQRPKGACSTGFALLQKFAGKTVCAATPVGSRQELPTWTQWLQAYARALDYSVRQIRRLVMDEPRGKTVKQCGWPKVVHNNLIRAATAGYDLVVAIEAGADTIALCREIKSIMESVPEDILDHEYEPKRIPVPKRRARRVTE